MTYSPPEYLPEPYKILSRPLWWHSAGLSQTASGYGAKLISSRCVQLPDGKIRRIYVTQWGNAGSAWITLGGRRVHLADCGGTLEGAA